MQFTIREIIELAKTRLKDRYDEREILSLAHHLMEHLNYKKSDIYGSPQTLMEPELVEKFSSYLKQLESGKPLQYVLGYAWFRGNRYNVSPDVLIPRPETEELVEWIVNTQSGGMKVLDMGTGSGCIAISLSLELPDAKVFATDKTKRIIDLAKLNADNLGADVQFVTGDLFSNHPGPAQFFDLIVSNPPYIPESEKVALAPHVIDYEPGDALFVPDHDRFLYYKAILDFSRKHLVPGGWICFEIHEDTADEMNKLMKAYNLSFIEIRNDLHGKPRMVRGMKP